MLSVIPQVSVVLTAKVYWNQYIVHPSDSLRLSEIECTGTELSRQSRVCCIAAFWCGYTEIPWAGSQTRRSKVTACFSDTVHLDWMYMYIRRSCNTVNLGSTSRTPPTHRYFCDNRYQHMSTETSFQQTAIVAVISPSMRLPQVPQCHSNMLLLSTCWQPRVQSSAFLKGIEMLFFSLQTCVSSSTLTADNVKTWLTVHNLPRNARPHNSTTQQKPA